MSDNKDAEQNKEHADGNVGFKVIPRDHVEFEIVRGKSSQLEIKVSKEGKGAVFFGKIKTTNRSRYTVRPKRFVLNDDAAGTSCQIQVQLVRSACEAILRKGRATSSDKFLVQIFKPAESAHEKLKDLPEEEVESFLERLCRKAEKEAGKDAGKAHIETPSGSIHFKYLRTRFKLGELSAPKEEIAMNRKLFDELIELRKLYEETVMESVEYMAREEQLRMKLEATRSEYAKLEKATRGGPSQQVSSGNASEAISTAFRPHISVVHVLIVALFSFFLGRYTADTSTEDSTAIDFAASLVSKVREALFS